MTKFLKILGWIVVAPIIWVLALVIGAVSLALALIQAPFLPPKIKNYGLTPPDKSIIVQN